MTNPQVWSSGGGVQSTAIAAAIIDGRLPKPDYAVIADTGREKQSTWNYLNNVVSPKLRDVGVEIEVVPHSFQPDSKSFNTVDLLSGKDGKTIIMPMHSKSDQKGGTVLSKYCSNEWKSRPIHRYLKRVHGITKADMWVGFTIDEAHRMKFNPKDNWRHVYPLVDLRLTRGDCLALVEKMGWPTPPRSSCYMCPLMNAYEWQDVKNNAPLDFERAVKLERYLRRVDEKVFFHRQKVPLNEVDFSDKQDDLFAGCESGQCFT